jgi:hypothetical protein
MSGVPQFLRVLVLPTSVGAHMGMHVVDTNSVDTHSPTQSLSFMSPLRDILVHTKMSSQFVTDHRLPK